MNLWNCDRGNASTPKRFHIRFVRAFEQIVCSDLFMKLCAPPSPTLARIEGGQPWAPAWANAFTQICYRTKINLNVVRKLRNIGREI